MIDKAGHQKSKSSLRMVKKRHGARTMSPVTYPVSEPGNNLWKEVITIKISPAIEEENLLEV
jgi:hypothetical protein